MIASSLRRLICLLFLVCAAWAPGRTACAAPVADPSRDAPAAAAAPPPAPADDAERDGDARSSAETDRFHRHARAMWRNHRKWDDRRDGDAVSIGHDYTVAEGQKAQSVVSIFGSSTNAGDAVSVVSILGDTRVTGTVEDAAVAVLGNTYIDGKVDGDAVAVAGSVELGPHAEIGGNVVSVLGVVRRDPASIVHGGVHNIFAGDFGSFIWLRTWITHCLMYGRPLSFAPGLGWAWGMALGFLAFYACLAVLCRPAIERCVHTFEKQPAQTLLAAIVAMLLWPVLLVLLCITLIGIAAVPFAVTAIMGAVLFGKAVMLAWIGGRFTGGAAAARLGHPAVAVLAGGALVLLLYLVPVLGFLVYNILGILGFGTVVYTLILAVRARQAAKTAPAPNDDAARAGASAEAAGVGAAAPPSAASAAPAAPQVVAALPRAGFWIRMAALFLDILLVGFALSVLHHVVHLHLLVLAIYAAVMWKLRGSTVGGIVFDLQVVRVDGRPLDWETAIIRALGCFLSLAVAGLGFIWIAFDHANQGWHDKIAGTVVVRVPAPAPRKAAQA